MGGAARADLLALSRRNEGGTNNTGGRPHHRARGCVVRRPLREFVSKERAALAAIIDLPSKASCHAQLPRAVF